MMRLIAELGGGNMGAQRICFDIMEAYRDQGDKVEALLLYMQKMGLKGNSIWRAYKDWAGEDLDKFAQGVLDDDQSMLDVALQREPGISVHRQAVKAEATKPVFTTSHPGFMGDTSDRNDEFIEKMQGETAMEGFPKKGRTSIYIDGTLESNVGFDIPIWLSGTIRCVRRQECQVWNVEGDVCYEAVITLTPNACERGSNFWGGLITLPGEEREFSG
jgi:hypothetical protein